jgi:tRNA pseudouridine38-40 synthase
MGVDGNGRIRYRAIIEYEGTAYVGFQRQRQPNSVQEQLEQALAAVTQQPTTVIGAGRTDSGVHATGQVISFDLDWSHGAAALHRALNVHLPPDIAVRALDPVDSSFHPRFDARRRVYEYHIYNSPVRSPIRRQRSWHVVQPLSLVRMNQAAALLIGAHDFATFGRPPQGENTIRHVFVAEWRQEDESFIFTIAANAFLYRMVRTIVGCLKKVGEDSWDVAQFEAAFDAADRRHAAAVAPAYGLYLVAVLYE